MAAKIKKKDRVIVTKGRDKGKIGEVLEVFHDENRIVVSGVHMLKKHQKPSAHAQGGIITKEGTISVSNVAHIDPKTNKPTRVGFKVLADGRKVRVARKSGEVIDK